MRISRTVVTLATAVTVGGFGAAQADWTVAEPTAYEVPGGVFYVESDGAGYFEPDDTVILAQCGRDDVNPETGEWHEPAYACAPMYAPDGAELTDIWEDGAAAYGDSVWRFDPERATFVQD